MSQQNVTKVLSEFIVELNDKDIPITTKERCADLLLDHLAVSIAGIRLPWSQVLREYASQQRSKGESTIYGGFKTSADLAALVNGTTAHGIELDDTHEASVSHPGAVVFATVLALAQELKSSPQETVVAIVSGYEAMGRIGSAFDPDFMARGMHPTANHGVFGACTGAAKLLGLTAEELNIAWGIATSLNSGSMAFTEDPKGTMVKRLHAGWPAHGGVVAAKLAKLGFTGPRETLDRRRGYIGTHSPTAERQKIINDLGNKWVVDEVSIKPYACCRLFHSSIDAIKHLRSKHNFSHSDVHSVKAYGSKHMIDGHMEYRPQSVMSAQYSLPFSLSVALCSDASDPKEFSEEKLNLVSVLAVADMVDGIVRQDLEDLFPEKYSGSVEIKLKDGRTLVHTVLDCSGSANNPLGREEIKHKFLLLTDGQIDSVKQKKILETVDNFQKLTNVSDLTDLLLTGADYEDQR